MGHSFVEESGYVAPPFHQRWPPCPQEEVFGQMVPLILALMQIGCAWIGQVHTALALFIWHRYQEQECADFGTLQNYAAPLHSRYGWDDELTMLQLRID